MLERLRDTGFCVLPAGAIDPADLEAPWAFAEHLLGETPRMVERQIIRAMARGRSFASTNVETPLHNDLQLFLGRPPDLQVMACRRQAAQGGESLVLDMWPLVEGVAKSDPAFFEALFDQPRELSFVSGPIKSPTIALFDDRVAFLHSPRRHDDALAPRIAKLIAEGKPHRFELRAGEVLVVDNHRALHGRTAFVDPDRELVRFLVWTRSPRPVPPRLLERATRAPWRPATQPIAAASEADLALALKMLAGASPGALAARSGRPEPDLYELRDAVIRAALDAIAIRKS